MPGYGLYDRALGAICLGLMGKRSEKMAEGYEKSCCKIPAVKKNTMKTAETAKTAEKENSGSQEDRMYDVLRADILDLKLRPGLVFSIRMSATHMRWGERRSGKR